MDSYFNFFLVTTIHNEEKNISLIVIERCQPYGQRKALYLIIFNAKQ